MNESAVEPATLESGSQSAAEPREQRRAERAGWGLEVDTPIAGRRWAVKEVAAGSASPVQAVILAAGRGSRLEGESRGRPKCLAEVGGLPLVEHHLRCLSGLGIRHILVVAGYLANQVPKVVGNRAALVYNDLWATSNSLYSLSLCRQWVSGSLLVINCDVLAHPEIMVRLLMLGGNAFAYDSTSGSEAEHMKVRLEGGTLRAMSKALTAEHCHGENVGMLYFEANAAQLLFEEVEAALRAHGPDVFAASAVERVARKIRLRGIDVSDLPWVEIDYPADLDLARRVTWPAISSRPLRI